MSNAFLVILYSLHVHCTVSRMWHHYSLTHTEDGCSCWVGGTTALNWNVLTSNLRP